MSGTDIALQNSPLTERTADSHQELPASLQRACQFCTERTHPIAMVRTELVQNEANLVALHQRMS